MEAFFMRRKNRIFAPLSIFLNKRRECIRHEKTNCLPADADQRPCLRTAEQLK